MRKKISITELDSIGDLPGKTRGGTLSVTEFARMGGIARSKKMSKKRRSESARKAARARWAKEKS